MFGTDELVEDPVAGNAALVEAACEMAPEPFRTAARHWRSLADDLVATHDAYQAHQRRFLTTATTFAGRGIAHFEADHDAFDTFTRAVDSYLTHDQPDDPSPRRSLGQRRADALVELCAEILARRERSGRPTPRADLVVDVATLTGRGLADLAGVRCELTRTGPISRVVIERLGCDSAVGRIVTNGASEVLDVGRRTRVVTPAQRRALDQRDRGCVFPGCDRAPDWTDAHHIVHWTHGGSTDLDNLALLCRRHHVLCHEGHWQLKRGDDGTVTAIPP